MYNYNELNAVALSPTKKDYYQIWNELIEVASKLSERWDPSATNESDPGIVLLKVLTAIADKLNYNIDANTLEAFMPSAAQESSMRKLCEMLGYEMRYYQSASTTVRINYKGSTFPTSTNGVIYIDRFTNIHDAESTVNFVTLEPVLLAPTKRSETVECLEGEMVVAQTDLGTTVTLNHLDDNLRFYLPERQIAANGIFISNVGTDAFWKQTDNLNTSLLGSSVYKFGYDSSKSLPYIQFPDDIGSLIGTGLNIRFVRTRGVSGNISSSFLRAMEEPYSWSTIKSQTSDMVTGEDIVEDSAEEPTEDWSDLEQYSITNLSAARNGKNPETIDEAYWNYQKQVGTFDTLVTCRDYMNKIYQMTRSEVDTTPLVSNIIVSDIRDDINRAYTLTSLSEQGIEFERFSRKESDNETNKIEYFDLMLYPFQATFGLNTADEFENSFKYTSDQNSTIIASLDNSKTIAHKFKVPADGDIACIKAYFQVSARLTTTSKISLLESVEVEAAAHNALYKDFNLRNMSFGEELPFESILQTLTLADPRIKNVTLDDPKLAITVCTVDHEEYPIVTDGIFGDLEAAKRSAAFYKQLVLDNVLAGRIALFNYDTTFANSFADLEYPVSKATLDTTASVVRSTETLIPLKVLKDTTTGNVTLYNQFDLTDLIVYTTGSAERTKTKTFTTTRPGTLSCKLELSPDFDPVENSNELNYQHLLDLISDIRIQLFAPGAIEENYTLNVKPFKRDINLENYDSLQTYLSWKNETGLEVNDVEDSTLCTKDSFILYPSIQVQDLNLQASAFNICQIPLNASNASEVFDKVTIKFTPILGNLNDEALASVLKWVKFTIEFAEAYTETSLPEDLNFESLDYDIIGLGSVDKRTEVPVAINEAFCGEIRAYWPGAVPNTAAASFSLEDLGPWLGTMQLVLKPVLAYKLLHSYKLAFKATNEPESTVGYLALTTSSVDSQWVQLTPSFDLSRTFVNIQSFDQSLDEETQTLTLTHSLLKGGISLNKASFGDTDLESLGEISLAKVSIIESSFGASYQPSGLIFTFIRQANGHETTLFRALNTLNINWDDSQLELPDLIKASYNSSQSANDIYLRVEGVDDAIVLNFIPRETYTPAEIFKLDFLNDEPVITRINGNSLLRNITPPSNNSSLDLKLSSKGIQFLGFYPKTNINKLTLTYGEATTTSSVSMPIYTDLSDASAIITLRTDEQSGAETLGPLNLKANEKVSAPTKITSDFKIHTELISNDEPLVLAKNEVVQFRSPNFKTTATYPAYVNYFVKLNPSLQTATRAKSFKKSTPAIPATMLPLAEFLRGGPEYEGMSEYVAYPAQDIATLANDGWNFRTSWEEKINSMPSGLLKKVFTISKGTDVDDGSTQEALIRTEYNRKLTKYGALFTKTGLVKGTITEGNNTVKDAMVNTGETLADYRLFEPISDFAFPESLDLYAFSLTQDNFELFLKWLNGTAGKITYREDIATVPAGTVPEELDLEHMITEVYTRARSNKSRSIGYLVDENKFKYTEAQSLGNNTIETLYIPRLWADETTTHTKDGLGADAQSNGIKANTEYQLRDGEYILINYSTSEGREDGTTVIKNVVIPAGSIVKANCELVDSEEKAQESNYSKTADYGPWILPDKTLITTAMVPGMFTLGATEQIEVREPIEVQLDDAISNLYWEIKDPVIRNGFEVFPFSEGSYILQPGEYLFYTNEAKESFVYYGAGTEIRKGKQTPDIKRREGMAKMSSNEINDAGVVAAIPWTPFNLSGKDAAITISEYQVINLVEGDSLLNVTLVDENTDSPIIQNKFKRVYSAAYIVSGLEGSLPELAIDNYFWEARGKFEINMSASKPQTLVAHRNSAGQEVARTYLYIHQNKTITDTSGAVVTTTEIPTQVFTALPKFETSEPAISDDGEIGATDSTEKVTDLAKAVRDGAGMPETVLNVYSSVPLVGADGDLRFVTAASIPSFKLCASADLTYSSKLPCAPAFQEGMAMLDLSEHFVENVLSDPLVSLSALIPDTDHFGLFTIYYDNRKSESDDTFAAIAAKAQDGTNLSLKIFNYNSDPNAAYYDTNTKRYNWTWWDTDSVQDSLHYLKPGLNIVVIDASCTIDIFTNNAPIDGRTRSDILEIGELKIISWNNMLNYQLAFNSHNLALEQEYDTRLWFKYYRDNTDTSIVEKFAITDAEALEYIRNHDKSHSFYYTYQPSQESGLDLNSQDPTDTMALPKAWFDTQNLANKFVVSSLDTKYLQEFVRVSKFSLLGGRL